MAEQIILNVGANTSPLDARIAASAAKGDKLFANLGGLGRSGLGQITKDFDAFDRSLKASNARVIAFGLSAGIILGVSRAFSNMVKQTVEVDAALRNINVILQLSNKNFKTFSTTLFDIARQTGKPFKDISEGAVSLSRAGLGAAETLKRLKDAATLARLSGLDLNASVETITASLGSFNKSLLDSTILVSKFAAVDAAFSVSSKDLAESIKRVGSASEDVGVDINNLLGLITSARQLTGREGPVIAQALNSVFSRISRPETIEDLRELGVEINNTQNGVQKLQALSRALEVANEDTANLIRFEAGGVRNLNVLSAVLKDVNNEYGVYARATKTAANATNEAQLRNEELNKSFSSLINKTGVNLVQLSSQLGNITIGPALERSLGVINTVLESAFSKNSDSLGEVVGKGLLKGLGEAISGPGLALIAVTVGKLIATLGVEAGQGLKSILGLNNAVKQRAAIEVEVNNILKQQPTWIALAAQNEAGLLQVTKLVNAELLKRAAITPQQIVASAVSSRIPIDRRSGKIPSFADTSQIPNFSPLSVAISREKASVSAAQIRIGSNPSLVSPYNPGGLGVYNTRDEPGGLGQGISRALREGRNPKTYNVPNFAPQYYENINSAFNDPFKRPPGTAALNPQKSQDLENIIEIYKKEFKKGALNQSHLNLITEDLGKAFNLSADSVKNLSQRLQRSFNAIQNKGFVGYNSPIGPKIPLQLGYDPLTPFKERAAQLQREAINRGRVGYDSPIGPPDPRLRLSPIHYSSPGDLPSPAGSPISNIPFSPLRTPRGIHYQFPGGPFTGVFEHQNADPNSFRYLPGGVPPPLRMAASQIRYGNEINPNSFGRTAPGFNTPQQIANRIQQQQAIITALAKQQNIQERYDRRFGFGARTNKAYNNANEFLRRPGFQNASLAGSFLIPTLAGGVAENFDQRTIGGRGTAQSIQSGANALSYGLLGSQFGGIAGAGVGLGIGGLLEVPRVIKAFTDKIPDLNREIERLTERVGQANDGFGSIIQTNEKLAQYGRGELDLNPLQYGNLKTSRNEQINQLSLLFPKNSGDIRKAALSGSTEELDRVVSPLIRLDNQQRQLQQIQALGQTIRPDSSLARAFSSRAKDEDINKYITAQLSQRSSDPNNDLQIPDFLLNNPKLIDQLEGSYKGFARSRAVSQKGIDYANRNTTATEDGIIISSKYREDIEKLYINKSRTILEQSRKEITGVLTELEKSGQYEGLGDLIKKLNDTKEGDIIRYEQIFKEIQKKFPVEQLREALGRQDQIKNTVKRFNDFSLSLEVFGEGLDSLSARLNIINQSKLENIQRNLGRQTSSIQNAADINSIKSSTNPFLSLGFQTGASRQNALLTRDAQLEIARLGAQDQNQKSIAGLFSKLKDSLFSNLSNGTSVNAINLQGNFEQLLGKLLPNYNKGSAGINLNKSPLGLYSNLEIPDTSRTFGFNPNKGLYNSPIDAIANLSGGQREEFTKNAQSTLAGIEKQLRNPETAVGGVKRKILEQERKILQLYIDENLLTDTKLKADLDKAQKDLADIESKIQEDNAKQRVQFIETLASTYSDYIGNMKALRENAASVYEEAKKLGLTGRDANRFINFEGARLNRPLLEQEIRGRAIDSDTYRKGISESARANLEYKGSTSREDLNDIFKSSFGYDKGRDLGKDLISDMEGIREALTSIRPAARDAFSSMVDGSKSADDAFRDFGVSMATNILNKVSNLAFDNLFGSLFNNNTFGAIGSLFSAKSKGGVVGYASGGMVTGGSGVRDDVPAMLANGAYVIKKSSVNKYGSQMLSSLNSGRGFASGGINQILRNEFSTTGNKMGIKGSFSVDPRLSVIGQTDENNPSNALKFGREQDYYGYLGTIENYKKAVKQFEAAKTQRLIGAYVSGIINIGGYGLANMKSSTPKGVGKGIDSNGFQNTYSNFAALGGLSTLSGIKRYANGGMADSIPALLTSGEFVMSPQAVNRMGVGFMNKLNQGQISPRGYITGGFVGRDINASSAIQQGNNGDWGQINSSLLKLIQVNEEIRSLQDGTKNKTNKEKNDNTNNNESNTLVPQVSIIINMASNGDVKGQSSQTNNEGPDSKNMKAFAELIKNVSLDTIVTQMRPGGLLSSSVRK